MKECVPIRFTIMTSGEVNITLNHFTVDQDVNIFNIAVARFQGNYDY